MNNVLRKKVDFAIRLLQSAEGMANKVGQPVEICYSGGKDSDVILELAKMSGINYRAIYKNTTIDPPGTIKHAKDMCVEVMQPKYRYFELIGMNGFPNRFARHCCKYLKEYKVLDYAVIGVRREESRKRTERYKEPEECRVYSKNVKARHYLPLLDWTSQEVADFLSDRGIKCHDLYYDEKGVFHPERRLGCMGCPLKSIKKRLEDFREHPNIIKAYLRWGQIFRDLHPEAKTTKRYKDVYEQVCRDVFFAKQRDFDNWKVGLFGEVDYKKFIEEYFKIKL